MEFQTATETAQLQSLEVGTSRRVDGTNNLPANVIITGLLVHILHCTLSEVP
jgi:hypothetical protein